MKILQVCKSCFGSCSAANCSSQTKTCSKFRSGLVVPLRQGYTRLHDSEHTPRSPNASTSCWLALFLIQVVVPLQLPSLAQVDSLVGLQKLHEGVCFSSSSKLVWTVHCGKALSNLERKSVARCKACLTWREARCEACLMRQVHQSAANRRAEEEEWGCTHALSDAALPPRPPPQTRWPVGLLLLL